jgi:hypothetical protein
VTGQPNRPPPGAGSQSFEPAPPRPATPTGLRWLPFLFGAGAVFWLVQLVQFAAVVAAPNGRIQLEQAVIRAGAKGDVTMLLTIEVSLVFFIVIAAAALHATAYFGLRRRRPWGWVAALIAAIAWSLVLVGIPVVYVLVKSSTRRAYGVS